MNDTELNKINNVKKILVHLRLLRSHEIPTTALLAYKTNINPVVVDYTLKYLESEVGALTSTGYKEIAGSIRQTWKVNHLICQQMIDSCPEPQEE